MQMLNLECKELQVSIFLSGPSFPPSRASLFELCDVGGLPSSLTGSVLVNMTQPQRHLSYAS